ncbi:phosphopantetheine-binding protein, partial [Rhodococcus sp. BP22]|uniref:phosphopantetheine-binding protein n=1 Tax=Rhodococcus sp. BP22 TaxID=2758566 RepID=UPI0016442186
PELPSAGSGRTPRNETEVAIARVFAEVLGAEAIGLDESFFDLGGDSLSATRVTARVNAALGSNISVRMLFESPTVATLSTRTTDSAVDSPRPILGVVERPSVIPLS